MPPTTPEPSPSRRIVAIFHPQAWVNDYAIELDGRHTIDVTERILAMPREQALAIRDDQYESDHLLTEEEKHHHHGSFWVEVEDAIATYFAATSSTSAPKHP